MSESAIAELDPATEAATPGATEGGTPATDPVVPVQTEPSAVTSLLDAIKAGDDADIEARIKEEARRLAQVDKAEKRSVAYKATLASKFNDTANRLVAALGEDAAQPVWDAINALHLSAGETAIAPVKEEYEEWLEGFIPEADLASYRKETEGKSTDTKFRKAAEYLVTSTNALKSMALDDFAKHSTKGRSDLKAALTAAEEAGYQRGLAAPAGDATGDAEKRTPSTPTSLTAEAAATLPINELIRLRRAQTSA